MLVRYFRRPSRIEQLRSSTGGYLQRRTTEIHQERHPGRSSLPRNKIQMEKWQGRVRLAHRVASLHRLGQTRGVRRRAGERRPRSDRGRTALSRVQERPGKRCRCSAHQAASSGNSCWPDLETRPCGQAGRTCFGCRHGGLSSRTSERLSPVHRPQPQGWGQFFARPFRLIAERRSYLEIRMMPAAITDHENLHQLKSELRG